MTEFKKLYRSRKDKMIAGICGGIGATYHIDATLVRLALVFLCIITGIAPLLFVYLIGWIIIPQK